MPCDEKCLYDFLPGGLKKHRAEYDLENNLYTDGGKLSDKPEALGCLLSLTWYIVAKTKLIRFNFGSNRGSSLDKKILNINKVYPYVK